MAIVAFSKPVSLPIASLRDMLGKHVPGFRWQCGDDDTGAVGQMGSFGAHGIIAGRSAETVVFTEYRARAGQAVGAPPHEWHLELSRPTTDHQPTADRITAVICAVVMILDEHHAHCQPIAGGPWFPTHAMPDIVRVVANGATLADVRRARSSGARASSRPRRPALRWMVGWSRALRSRTVGRRRRWPGSPPPPR